MADLPATPPAQVQLETLRAFSKDLELSIRTEAKGYGSKAVELTELRRWLDDALASNSDEPRRPKESIESAAWLSASPRKKVLTALLERLTTRVEALAKGEPVPDTETTREWLVNNLADLSANQAQVLGQRPKGGSSIRAASKDEVKQWLTNGHAATRQRD